MKLAFSTLGCPDWSFSEIFSTAKDLNFNGIEIRGVGNELYVPRAKRFLPEKIESTIKKLNDGNIEIPILTSGIAIGTLTSADQCANAVAQAKEYIDLAEKISAKYIRIMISSKPEAESVDLDRAIELYTEMCKYGENKGVTPLMETNGILGNSKACVEFMETIKSENKGILWDIHHPYRYFNETIEQTVEILGDYIKHVHVKDSVVKDDKIIYRMMGYGDIPIFDALKSLNSTGYAGYVSLEWVKRWNPELEEPGIVFAHFMSYISFAIARL